MLQLQAERVKLQDWLVETRHKLAILFAGRRAAGKGGVIERITQWLNPRVCRVAVLRRRPTTGNAGRGTSSVTCRIRQPAAR